MRDIVIVAQYLRDIENFEGNNSRFVYLAKMLRDKQCYVEIITSDYHHSPKTHFKNVGELEGIKVTAIHEPGYPKNVCLKRFSSHKELAKNIKKYLSKRKKPDAIYVAVPSLAVAEVCAGYCKANKVKFIVDIQDLWPEAFKMVFSIPVISDIGFYPMKKQADNIYAAADEIVAVSQTYADRALRVNSKCKLGKSIYLGTDLKEFDNIAEDNKLKSKPKGEVWLSYIGTLGYSYDLVSVIDALKILKDKGINNIKFIVMGDGPLKSKFEKYAKEKGIYAEFTGGLSYVKMVGILTVCDIAVNPIRKGSSGSIINKVGDYAAAGLPVINTQENPEYQNLLIEYNAGLNCANGNALDLADKLLILYNDILMKMLIGQNNRKLAEDKFDRQYSYKTIIDIILE